MEHTLQLTAERSVAREALKGIIWTIFFHRLFGPITPTTNEFLDSTYPMAANLPDLDSLIDERIAELIRDYFDVPSVPSANRKLSASASTSIATATTASARTKNNDLDSPSTSPLPSNIIANPNNVMSPTLSRDSARLNQASGAETVTEIRYGQIVVQFLDKSTTTKKKAGWFGQSKTDSDSDLKPWETWTINVKCMPLELDHTSLPHSATSSIGDYLDMSDKKSAMAATTESFEGILVQIIDIADTRKDHIPPITSLESSPFPYTIQVKRNKASSNDDASWGQYIKKILD